MMWDKNLKIDTTMYKTSEARRATQIQAYIDMYAGRKNLNIKEPAVTKAISEKWITEEQFKMLKDSGVVSNLLKS